VHALIDGRDVGETSALDYLEPFEAWIAGLDPNYGIASGGGRMFITLTSLAGTPSSFMIAIS